MTVPPVSTDPDGLAVSSRRPTVGLDGVPAVPLALRVRAGFWLLADTLAHWALPQDALALPDRPGEHSCLRLITAELARHGTDRMSVWVQHHVPASDDDKAAITWAYRTAHRLWGAQFGVSAGDLDAAIALLGT